MGGASGPSRTQNVMNGLATTSVVIGSAHRTMAVPWSLLSGALGSAPTLTGMLHCDGEGGQTVVLGPPWLGAAVGTQGRALVMSKEVGDSAAHAAARAQAAAGAGRWRRRRSDLPLRRGALRALLVENVAGLPEPDAARWLAGLVP